VAVCRRDVDVEYRDTAAGQRQHEALSRFQRDAGLDATQAARTVGLSYPQYNRYLWGRLPLRTDQIPRFAAAYGVPKSELTRALGLLDDAMDQPWSMREALRSHLTEDEIERQVEKHKDAPLKDQQAAVGDLIEMAGEIRDERTAESLRRPRRDQTA
jgi:hypothetical protein